MSTKTKVILLLSLPRSGSNYFVNQMHHFKNVKVCGEVFGPHPNIIYPKKIKNWFEINKKICVNLLDNPNKINKEFLFMKFFLYEENKDILKFLLDNYNISNIFILERKNIVDRYISFKKASNIKKWLLSDTTNIKINFDIEEYSKFKKFHIKTYETYKKIIKNKNYCYVEYQSNFNDDLFLNKIKTFIPDLNLNKNKIFLNRIKKQDLSTNYKDKIENYNEIKNFIFTELN